MTTLIPLLPTPVPQSTDPQNFAARADAFLAALPPFAAAANTQAQENNQLNASTVAAAEVAKNASDLAVAAIGASKFDPAATYLSGAQAWSPVTGKVYRRLVAGRASVDPSTDAANWILTGSPAGLSNGTNLDDVTGLGEYVCGTSSASATIINKPVGLGGGAFGMQVYNAGGQSGGSVRVRQVISSYSSGALPKIWTRTRSDNGVWTLWDQIITSSTSAERILIDAGSAAAPSLCFSADQSTGFYKLAGAIGASYAGVSIASFHSLGTWSNRLALGSANANPNQLLTANASVMDPNVDVRGISVDISTGPGALTASHTYRGGWLRATGDMTAQDKGSFAVTVIGSLIEGRSATTAGNVGEATELRGVHAQATDSAGKTTALNFAYGAYCYCNHTGTGSVTNSIGVIGFVQNNNAGNTISTVEGVRSAVTNSAGTVDTAHLFRGTYTGTFTTKWGIRLSGDSQNQIEGWLNITNTTASTNSTTGALRVSGGAGIAGDMFVGGGLAASGPVRVGQYTLTTLPSASAFNGYEIDVTNAAGGSKRCRSNGSVWQILNTTTTVS